MRQIRNFGFEPPIQEPDVQHAPRPCGGAGQLRRPPRRPCGLRSRGAALSA